MNIKSPSTFALLILTVTLLTSCNKELPKPQSVVINVGSIAVAIGIKEQIENRIEEISQQIADEIESATANLKKEIDDEKASLDESPSEAGEEKIQDLRNQKRKQIAQIRKDGNRRRVEETNEIKESFLAEVSSISRQVALEHGSRIILKAISVFWFEDSVDITDEVLGRMTTGKDVQPADEEQI